MVLPIARLVKILRGRKEAAVEVLPPGDRPRGYSERSVEARADAFVSLFLNAERKDPRDPRTGPR
ncbi:MAG TPA: hypothetical protein VGM26_16225 [Rhizomicrobium sp.]|jgi:hypothetical protein